MADSPSIETEIKLPVQDLVSVADRLATAGFVVRHPMQEEESVLWDREGTLLARQEALRLRRYAGETRLTWKGPRMEDPTFKVRPEEETRVEDAPAMEAILRALGFSPIFRMVKRRAVMERPGLSACLDETPFGTYLELEGERETIQAALQELGLQDIPPETRSYPSLFRAWQQP